MLKRSRLVAVAVAAASLLPVGALQAEVILQYFEADWDEIYRRTPEIAEIGYDGIWTPSPSKSPVAGSNKWANVGYSLWDRFDIGDIPQRGGLGTRFGTRGDLRNMVDALHRSDIKIYPDIVFNHNGNGPDYRTYPGMRVNDFHVWQDSNQPGGWRRANRMSGYDDISNGYGLTFQEELVSLMDVVTEHDGRFVTGGPRFAAEPAPFVRHPGQFDKYPFNAPGSTLPAENVRQMLNRWVHWLGDAMDYDGFRLDAAKHVIREFYGGPGGGFLHEAQWNFDQRRGFTYNQNVPDNYTNGVRRRDMLMFAEIFAGASSNFDYWRQGNVRMRYLDFPLKQQVVGNAFSSGNLGALASLGAGLDPTEGVMFTQSHDQSGPSKLQLSYAWLLMRDGVPVVYFSGNNISWDDRNAGRTWVLPGIGEALGDYNGVIANLVYCHNQFARGREWTRVNENDYFAFERYQDLNGNANPDSGEGIVITALNDSGGDQTRTFPTSLPNGTSLRDYTGNNPDWVTVNNGQVTIRVPGRSGQGFVVYAPHNATANGEPLRFLSGGTPVGTIPWVVPGGRDAPAKPRTIPRLTGNSVTLEANYSDPVGGVVNNVIFKFGQGLRINSTASWFQNDRDIISFGYQQGTYTGPGGKWALTADLTNVPEGLHTVHARVFNNRSAGLPAIFQTFSKTVYVDRRGPDLVIESPANAATINGETVATIRNPDFTAGRVEVRLNGGAWQDAQMVMRGLWKFAVTGLPAGNHTLEVRASEFDQGATRAVINTSTATRNFAVTLNGPTVALNHANNAVINLPFFETVVTTDPSVPASSVKIIWDGYELVGASGTGTITHIFDGRYRSGGVEDRLWGAFVNGPHFFEVEVTAGGVTRRVARTVFFNLYGSNQVDSDGDGLPDEIELPGFNSGAYAAQKFPGDNNEDTIPNNGEQWSRLNPLNHATFYGSQWDGDQDWDGDGFSNLTEVRAGFQQTGNAYQFNIYDRNSRPSASTPSQASFNLVGNVLNIEYRPNNGPLQGVSPVYARVSLDGGAVQNLLMTNAGNGLWTLAYTVPSGALKANIAFGNQAGTTTDTSGGSSWQNIDVVFVPQVFNMNGQFDSNGYEVANNGMKILTAIRNGKLYVATWSANGGINDHFLLVSDTFSPSESAPWAKRGKVYFSKGSKPWLAGEGTPGNGFHSLSNGGSGGRVAMGTAGQALEGELDLVQVFGRVPEVLYLTAVAYGGNDGDPITSQCPAVWNGGDDIEIMEMQAVNTASIRDENADGIFDIGVPVLETVVNGASADGNYGLRRFYLDEVAGDRGEITVNFNPNVPPGSAVTAVELFTNLNRRNFARLEEDRSTVTVESNDTYFRAYTMSPRPGGGYTVTLPVTRCGAYRINARYKINNGPWIYYTDNAQRRDCAVVVSPKKALRQTMYEINPSIIEATSSTFAGRSTFRDLYTANTDRPDIINPDHFTALGVNMLWLQPIHPIGVEGRENDPSTSQPWDPGSPYAVRDYWSVAPFLGAANTAAGAMSEFSTFVSSMDAIGVGVMMDGTFNHSAPDAILGAGAQTLFPWASNTNALIRDVRPGWFSRTGNYGEPARNATEIAVAPDRSDFGKWNDVRDFYFGSYDALVKTASDANTYEFLLERDIFGGHTATTREIWEYFAYYPIYWLEKTGHPAGTPPEQSYKGIDGLRCDFAQGMPNEFWEYVINKTRTVKWDFLFMAESLDGFRDVGGSKRHGVSYRSSRHFDIMNENIVFYWRDQFYGFPANGPDPGKVGNRTTFPTFQAYDDRRNAYDNVTLLQNLTGHDEVFPSNDPYQVFYGYAQVASLDGIPMMLYGQEAGARNDFATYAFAGWLDNANNNWDKYELNFGKSIPNFKRWNNMQRVWTNRDWNLQNLYGRLNRARLGSPALQNQNVYFLERQTGGGFDPDVFAVAKFQKPGVSAGQQDVVFVFVNNDIRTGAARNQTFRLNAVLPGTTTNWFGIKPGNNYNIRNITSATPNTDIWAADVSGATLISNGLFVGLTGSVLSGNHAQYLRLIDKTENPTGAVRDAERVSTLNDGLPDWWKQQYGINVNDPNPRFGPNGDLDGDGMNNYQEFLAGTDPTNSRSGLTVAGLSKTGQDIDVTFRSVPNMDYRIRSSTNLNTWTDVLDASGRPLRVTALGTSTSVRVSLPPSTTKTFLRAEVLR